MPEISMTDAVSQVAALGPVWGEATLSQTRDIYAPFVASQRAGRARVASDLAYGTDPRQKLDVYHSGGAGKPVAIYIPGGGFVRGDKNMDAIFHRNLGVYYANHGIVAVVANYRLAPAHAWPAGSEDVGAVVAWAKANAAEYGGDPARLVVFGQSAGAAHAAGYVFDARLHPPSGVGVAAAILMSGVYRLADRKPAPNMIAYYGEDSSLYEDRSPLTHVDQSRVPLLISNAEYDPPMLAAPAFELAAAVTRRDGRSPQFLWARGHNHISTIFSIGSGQDDVAIATRDFILNAGA